MFGLVYRAKGMLFCLPSVCLRLSHARSLLILFIDCSLRQLIPCMYLQTIWGMNSAYWINLDVAVWWLGYAHPLHLLGKHSRLFIYINAIVSRDGSVRWRKQLCRLANWMLRKNVTLNEVHEHTGTGAATKQGKQANAIVTCHYYCFKERVFFGRMHLHWLVVARRHSWHIDFCLICHRCSFTWLLWNAQWFLAFKVPRFCAVTKENQWLSTRLANNRLTAQFYAENSKNIQNKGIFDYSKAAIDTEVKVTHTSLSMEGSKLLWREKNPPRPPSVKDYNRTAAWTAASNRTHTHSKA